MPGSVASAAPSGVFPQTLSVSYTETRAYIQLQSMLHDGTILRGQLAPTSRKTFQLAKRLKASDVATLKSLWDSNGPYKPFFFYNFIEGTPPGSNYDPTGNSTVGRYTVVFRQIQWGQTSGLALAEILGLVLVEVN